MTNTQTVKQELSKVDFSKIVEIATKKFTDACYDMGLSVEDAKRIMISKEGLDVISKEVAKLI